MPQLDVESTVIRLLGKSVGDCAFMLAAQSRCVRIVNVVENASAGLIDQLLEHFLDRCEIDQSVVGIRTHIEAGAKIGQSVLLGADFYEDGRPADGVPPLGIGRDVVLTRTIIDKNARIGDGVRLINERNVEHADGNGWYIRGGIVVVPKGGVIPPGTVV